MSRRFLRSVSRIGLVSAGVLALGSVVATAHAVCPRGQTCTDRGPQTKERPTTPIHTATGQPKFLVASVLYSPPGNKSSVEYGQESSIGTRLEMSSATSVGIKVDVDAECVKASFDASMETEHGSVAETKDSIEKGVKLEREPGENDDIDHGNDRIRFWANAQIDVVTVGRANDPLRWVEMTPPHVKAGDPDQKILELTVNEILGKSDISQLPADYRNVLQGMSAAQRQDLVRKFDPIALGEKLDPNRYTLLKNLGTLTYCTVDGCPSVAALKYTYERAQGDLAASSVKFGGEIMLGGEVDFVVHAGLFAGVTFEQTYKTTTEVTKSNAFSMLVELATATKAGPNDASQTSYDLYHDTLFNTVLFVPHGQAVLGQNRPPPPPDPPTAATVSGVVSDAAGRHLAGQPVTATFANGKKATTTTDKNGNYFFTTLPVGSYALSAGGPSVTVQAAVGHPVRSPLSATPYTPPRRAPHPSLRPRVLGRTAAVR